MTEQNVTLMIVSLHFLENLVKQLMSVHMSSSNHFAYIYSLAILMQLPLVPNSILDHNIMTNLLACFQQ
jgi:hypothetical protein